MSDGATFNENLTDFYYASVLPKALHCVHMKEGKYFKSKAQRIHYINLQFQWKMESRLKDQLSRSWSLSPLT